MLFTPLCLLASAVLTSGAPSPLQVSVTISNDDSLPQKPVTKLDDPGIVKYDDSRIQDYPDKKALAKARTFFEVFTEGKFDEMKALQSENYTMTDIPIGQIRLPRNDWYEVNKQFTSLLEDLRVIALSIDGDAEPGSFTVLEHLVLFTLKANPPPSSAEHLPEGSKAGDKLGMINVSVLWWGEDGIIEKELEYGRMTWKEFDLDQFDARNAAKYGYKVPKVGL